MFDKYCNLCDTLMKHHTIGEYWECPNCNNSITDEEIKEYGGFFDNDDVTYDVDETYTPSNPMCVACGDHNYPKCTTSCSRIDD